MGNRSSSSKSSSAFRPSRPKVDLSKRKKDHPIDQFGPRDSSSSQDLRNANETSITEEVKIRWKAPARCKKSDITGYHVEMWDLPTSEWILVHESETNKTSCVLSNILSGVLYQFRIIAMTDRGPSYPSEPCEPFLVNIPNVSIAPYWIKQLPQKTEAFLGESLTLHVKALATPNPSIQWISEGENLFISEGIDIVEDSYGSELHIDGERVAELNRIECVAINSVGKCATSTELTFPPKFQTHAPHKIIYREGDVIRLKLSFFSRPIPSLEVRKPLHTSTNPLIRVKEDHLTFQIDSAKKADSGYWSIIATNEVGSDMVVLDLLLKLPLPRPNKPEVEKSDYINSVSLSWTMPPDFISYHPKFLVEYYRDRWQIWLNGKTCHEPTCVLSDLVPNSKYKFRVRFLGDGDSEVSEPSEETEMIFIGDEEDNDDFQSFNLPQKKSSQILSSATSKRTDFFHSSIPNLQRQDSVQLTGSGSNKSSNNNITTTNNAKGFRQASLDREVYFSDYGQRKEVVTYNPGNASPVKKHHIGKTVIPKYRLSGHEEDLYRKSLTNLCNMINKVKSSSSISGSSRNSSTESLSRQQQKQQTSPSRGETRRRLTRQAYSLDGPQPPAMSSLASKTNLSRNKGESTISLHDASKIVHGSVSRIASMQNLLKSTGRGSNPCFFGSMQPINLL